LPVDDIIKLCMVTSLVVFPAFAITVRFALKPIVDAIVRLKEGGVIASSQPAVAGAQDVSLLAAEMRHLREDVSQLQQSVAQLQDAEAFHRSLSERAAPPQIAPPPQA
jgi:uncharacterized protein YlxW (UPF0749 family)